MLLTLTLPWEMLYFWKTATVNPNVIERFCLWNCVNHSIKDRGKDRFN